MSRFWEKILRVEPPFNGTPEQQRANVESHSWYKHYFDQQADLTERSDIPAVIACRVCKVMADSTAANWPCGQAPQSVTLEEWKRGAAARGDQSL